MAWDDEEEEVRREVENNDALRAAVQRKVQWRAFFFWWYLPFEALVSLRERQLDRERAVWDERHYYGWTHKDMVWRACFLQAVCRNMRAQHEVLVGVVLPVALFLAALAGFFVGRHH